MPTHTQNNDNDMKIEKIPSEMEDAKEKIDHDDPTNLAYSIATTPFMFQSYTRIK